MDSLREARQDAAKEISVRLWVGSQDGPAAKGLCRVRWVDLRVASTLAEIGMLIRSSIVSRFL